MNFPSIHQYLYEEEVAGIYKSAGVEAFQENAEDPPKEEEGPPDWKRRAKIVGGGLLGMGLGTLGSFGALELVRRHHPEGQQLHSKILPYAPLLGGAAGLAYSLWKAREQEELKRAVKPRPDHNP